MSTNILVSNIGLPSKNIGSWIRRISYFNERNDHFDYILSPSESPDEKHIFCKKRSRFTYFKPFEKWQLSNWIAKDFLKALLQISKEASSIQIVVMDDMSLLEAIALHKNDCFCEIELIFSFHGHLLNLPNHFGNKIDKVLFLTKLGYLESLKSNITFTPEVHVIGNGVRSDFFFPLASESKIALREKLGFAPEDEIIIWMANERPNKGLLLFLKIAKKIGILYPHVKILIVGNQKNIVFESKNLKAIGKLNHDLLPKYLQISDYYFFTTLWKEGFGLSVAEAFKCGNTIIASDNGGVKEVLESVSNAFLVGNPNIVQDWVTAFEKARKIRKSENFEIGETTKICASFQNYDNWEQRFLNAIS